MVLFAILILLVFFSSNFIYSYNKDINVHIKIQQINLDTVNDLMIILLVIQSLVIPFYMLKFLTWLKYL